MDIPTAPPASVTAGTTLKWTRSLSDHPYTAGWRLNAYLAGKSAAITMTAAADGDSHAVVFSAAVTAPLAAGTYTWSETVTLAGEVVEVGRGTINVLPSLVGATAGALQSPAERQLALLDAILERRYAQNGDMESFQVGNRAVSLIPTKELEGMRNRARWAVSKERNGGRIPPRKITFRGV